MSSLMKWQRGNGNLINLLKRTSPSQEVAAQQSHLNPDHYDSESPPSWKVRSLSDFF